jgi:hypothetical protein
MNTMTVQPVFFSTGLFFCPFLLLTLWDTLFVAGFFLAISVSGAFCPAEPPVWETTPARLRFSCPP